MAQDALTQNAPARAGQGQGQSGGAGVAPGVVMGPAKDEVATAKVLAAGSDGLSLKGCNDFVVGTKGHIYASDIGMYNQPKYAVATKIVYIPKGGKARVVAEVADTMALPNGIVLSPDEKTLY